ncbi:phage putative head morphogenesis protein, SPP1 gp7 family [Pseudomonas lutea]|uniref:Phage putative head morphogenesis protein, SPP1 gp7 family n=2 Tax=Pseudomonas TaxID=286 RepID=A0A9X8QM33_9PSED|nr:minor capsid protein [Pseudomonas lutea]SER50828.1 phage putative head morphogenesis protein, SPP1 gp7 family [Pseudomonas lutea]
MAANPALFDATVRHAVLLEQLKANQVAKFAPFLKELDRKIRAKLSDPDITEYTRKRQEKLLEQVDSLLLGIFTRFTDQLQLDLVDLAMYEAQFEASSLNNAAAVATANTSVAVTFEAVLPSAAAIKAAILTNPLSVRGVDGGKLLEMFIQGWTQTERQRVVGAIRQGFFEGQTTTQIIQAIRGTKAQQYKDGILAITDRNASAVVRTAVQHVASQARSETLKANSDVVTGVIWVSTLDQRTSNQCRSLDSKVFPVDSGPRPPAHIGCRSTIVPITKFGKLFSQGATRSSKGAEGGKQVSASLSYYEWLKAQPASFQDQALGKARAKLFRDGGLSAERFSQLQLDRNFSPLTLDEMRALEPLAFERAGI